MGGCVTGQTSHLTLFGEFWSQVLESGFGGRQLFFCANDLSAAESNICG